MVADLDLTLASNLSVVESMLTGESVPVSKQATETASGAEPPTAATVESWVFSGTLVTHGIAQGCVMATGERSALGRIGASLAALGGENTPIQNEP